MSLPLPLPPLEKPVLEIIVAIDSLIPVEVKFSVSHPRRLYGWLCQCELAELMAEGRAG